VSQRCQSVIACTEPMTQEDLRCDVCRKLPHVHCYLEDDRSSPSPPHSLFTRPSGDSPEIDPTERVAWLQANDFIAEEDLDGNDYEFTD